MFLVGEWAVGINMISVMKIRGSIDCWEAVRFPVERIKTMKGAFTNHLPEFTRLED